MLLVAASCGDPQPPSTRPADASFGDFQPPRVIAAEPDDSERAVSVLTPLSVTFEEPLVAASVTSATVELRVAGDEAPQLVTGEVSYDDEARTIRFTPLEPLRHGRHYSLVLGDFTDLTGNVFVGQTIAFTTSINETTKQITYSGGAISEWLGSTLDAGGRVRSTMRYDAPGPDGQWLTEDDHAAERFDIARTSVDLVADMREYDAGPDGALGTADDVVARLERHRFDSTGRETDVAIYIGAGPDGRWATADDVPGSYQTKGWMGMSRIQLSFIDSPGADGVWRTGDDAGPLWHAYAYDTRDRLVRETVRSTGADRFAGTNDDEIRSHVDHAYDELGLASRTIFYNAAGADGMWLTDDDVVERWQRIEHDETGLVVATSELSAPGPDGTWLTDDDVISQRAVSGYAASRQRTSLTVFSGPGADASWGTADDAIASVTTTTYDAQGNRTDERRAVAPGPDATWGTADDVLASRSELDLAH